MHTVSSLGGTGVAVGVNVGSGVSVGTAVGVLVGVSGGASAAVVGVLTMAAVSAVAGWWGRPWWGAAVGVGFCWQAANKSTRTTRGRCFIMVNWEWGMRIVDCGLRNWEWEWGVL